MEMTELTKETALARIAQLPAGAMSLVRPVTAEELSDYFDMAKIGMTSVIIYQATFDEDDQLVKTEMTRSVDRCVPGGNNLEVFNDWVKSELLEPATDATGYLVQNSGGTGLYMHQPKGDTLIVCSLNAPKTDDCHCS